MYTDKELIEDLNQAAQKKGNRTLTKEQYKIYGKAAPQTIINHFGSWKKGLYIAGLKPGR